MVVVVACLIIVSSLAQICQGLGKLWSARLGLAKLVTKCPVKDQVGQGQGQELDNNKMCCKSACTDMALKCFVVQT